MFTQSEYETVNVVRSHADHLAEQRGGGCALEYIQSETTRRHYLRQFWGALAGMGIPGNETAALRVVRLEWLSFIYGRLVSSVYELNHAEVTALIVAANSQEMADDLAAIYAKFRLISTLTAQSARASSY